MKKPIYVTKPIVPNLDKLKIKLDEIWKSGIFSNQGKQHDLLEDSLKVHLKVNNLSLFNNGTSALMIALRGLNLTGETITTPFTFAATPHALTWCGIKPVFCDIEEDSYTIDPYKIEELITPKTSAILAVHVFGNPCNVQMIQDIANRNDLKVIYDSAHAFQTEIDGVGIGTFGDVSMFSFHPTKLFHTAEGGALACNSMELKYKLDLLKNFGIKNEEEVVLAGMNGKMNEIQAAIGLTVLGQLEENRMDRQKIKNTYVELLKNISGITHFNTPQNIKNSLQYFAITINKKEYGISRDDLYLKLKENNIFSRKYFYPLCSTYPHYAQEGSYLPIAEKTVKEILCLPFYGELSLEDVERICKIIQRRG